MSSVSLEKIFRCKSALFHSRSLTKLLIRNDVECVLSPVWVWMFHLASAGLLGCPVSTMADFSSAGCCSCCPPHPCLWDPPYTWKPHAKRNLRHTATEQLFIFKKWGRICTKSTVIRIYELRQMEMWEGECSELLNPNFKTAAARCPPFLNEHHKTGSPQDSLYQYKRESSVNNYCIFKSHVNEKSVPESHLSLWEEAYETVRTTGCSKRCLIREQHVL